MSGVIDPGVCPTCSKGKAEGSTVSLPNECCVIYFYGEGSWAHGQWRLWNKHTTMPIVVRKVVRKEKGRS